MPGVTLTATTPVPLTFVICGLLLALSTTVSDPARAPRTDGSNVIEIKQLAPARNVAGLIGHALVSTKSPNEELMLEMVSAVANPFLRVICREADVVFNT